MNTEELLNIPKLGFGFMRLPEKDGRIDLDTVCKMVDEYLECGFKYFDTAYVYNAGDSERAIRETLVKRYPRDSFYLATKFPSWAAKDEKDLERVFNEQLERTGAGYFDFYLLHGIKKENLNIYDSLNCWEWGLEMKRKGLIKHFGFSFHDSAELLDELLSKHPEVDFVQLQLNYADWESNSIQSRGVYEAARKHNKPIVVMEPVKGGNLAILRDDIGAPMKAMHPNASYASWALRFVASHEGILTILSGMSAMEQLTDNINTFKNLKPITEEEMACIEEVKERLSQVPTVPCTSCHYCVEGCPQKLAIPQLIQILNTYKTYGYSAGISRTFGFATAGGVNVPSSCVQCGQCEGVCPQHLPIVKIMDEAAAEIERR